MSNLGAFKTHSRFSLIRSCAYYWSDSVVTEIRVIKNGQCLRVLFAKSAERHARELEKDCGQAKAYLFAIRHFLDRHNDDCAS